MSEKTTTTPPSKEEFIAYMNEQIEVAKVRDELQALNTNIAKNRLEELQALSYIAQITNPSKQSSSASSSTVKHVVTEEDMKNNPELAEYGVKVGDEIDLPNGEEELLEKEPPAKSRKLKKD